MFAEWLEIDAGSHVLEVACGTGGPALFLAGRTGCRVTGVDLHETGITAAIARHGVDLAAEPFLQADARSGLPFDDATFDALVCIDAWNHLDGREAVLAMAPSGSGARLVFTDPIVVTGMLRRDEMAARSDSMGEFVFTPPVSTSSSSDAGFVDVRVEDAADPTCGKCHGAGATRAKQYRSDARRDRRRTEANAAFQRFPRGASRRSPVNAGCRAVAIVARRP